MKSNISNAADLFNNGTTGNIFQNNNDGNVATLTQEPPKPTIPSPLASFTSIVRYVTPEEATAWLVERNLHNRAFKKSNLRYIKQQMESGEFKSQNGQSIVFGVSGLLLDGQHRLQAMSDLGLGFWFNIVSGVPDDYFTTIDNGAKRSTSDAFEVRNIQYSAGVSGCVTFYLKFKKNPLGISNGVGSYGITAKDTLAEYEKNPQLFQDLYATGLKYNKDMAALTATQIAGFMAYTIFESRHGKRAEREFWAPLFSGDHMSPPIKMLRNKLISTFGQVTNKTPLIVKLTWIASTYNYHFTNKTVTRLRYDPQGEFPKII